MIHFKKLTGDPWLASNPTAIALGGELIGVIRPPIPAAKGIASVMAFLKVLPAGTDAKKDPDKVIIIAVVAVLLIHMPNTAVQMMTPNSAFFAE